MDRVGKKGIGERLDGYAQLGPVHYQPRGVHQRFEAQERDPGTQPNAFLHVAGTVEGRSGHRARSSPKRGQGGRQGVGDLRVVAGVAGTRQRAVAVGRPEVHRVGAAQRVGAVGIAVEIHDHARIEVTATAHDAAVVGRAGHHGQSFKGGVELSLTKVGQGELGKQVGGKIDPGGRARRWHGRPGWLGGRGRHGGKGAALQKQPYALVGHRSGNCRRGSAGGRDCYLLGAVEAAGQVLAQGCAKGRGRAAVVHLPLVERVQQLVHIERHRRAGAAIHPVETDDEHHRIENWPNQLGRERVEAAAVHVGAGHHVKVGAGLSGPGYVVGQAAHQKVFGLKRLDRDKAYGGRSSGQWKILIFSRDGRSIGQVHVQVGAFVAAGQGQGGEGH